MKTILLQLYLILAILWGLVSCGPPAVVPRAVIPTTPPQSASIAPAVESARVAAGKTAAASDRLERQVDVLKAAADELQDGMAVAVIEADRLRKQKSASEAELEALWQQLTKIHERNLFLEIQAEEAVKFAIDQKTLRTESEARVTALTQLAADRDAEVSNLRGQHLDMARTIHEQATAYDQQAALAAKQAARSSEAAGRISSLHRVILIAAILLILSVGLNVIQLKSGSLLL